MKSIMYARSKKGKKKLKEVKKFFCFVVRFFYFCQPFDNNIILYYTLPVALVRYRVSTLDTIISERILIYTFFGLQSSHRIRRIM